jgi:vacuolar protein sorting-associated protein 13A/C
MYLNQRDKPALRFMSSVEETGTQDNDLLVVRYRRAQRESPEFETVFEGIDQSVNMEISTFNFHAAPEPVVSLYNFVMTTFVPPPSDAPEPSSIAEQPAQLPVTPAQKPSLIHVSVKLAGVRCRNSLVFRHPCS